MLKLPTFPRRLRSKRVRPTTPTFLSDPDAPPPTKPVVYSPVPTMHTLRGAMMCDELVQMLPYSIWYSKKREDREEQNEKSRENKEKRAGINPRVIASPRRSITCVNPTWRGVFCGVVPLPTRAPAINTRYYWWKSVSPPQASACALIFNSRRGRIRTVLVHAGSELPHAPLLLRLWRGLNIARAWYVSGRIGFNRHDKYKVCSCSNFLVLTFSLFPVLRTVLRHSHFNISTIPIS